MDLTRIDASRNARRFYRMEIMPGLFGDWSLVREWDRIGQGAQVRVDWYDTEAGRVSVSRKIRSTFSLRTYSRRSMI